MLEGEEAEEDWCRAAVTLHLHLSRRHLSVRMRGKGRGREGNMRRKILRDRQAGCTAKIRKWSVEGARKEARHNSDRRQFPLMEAIPTQGSAASDHFLECQLRTYGNLESLPSFKSNFYWDNLSNRKLSKTTSHNSFEKERSVRILKSDSPFRW